MTDNRGHLTPEELHQNLMDCIQRWKDLAEGKHGDVSSEFRKRCENRIEKTRKDIEHLTKLGFFKVRT